MLSLIVRLIVTGLLLGWLFNSGRLNVGLLKITPTVVLSTLPFYLISFLAGIYRWKCLVKAIRFSVSWWDAIRLTMTGIWLSSVLPGGSVASGDAARAGFFAAENSDRRKDAFVSIIVDRILGMLAIFIIAFLSLSANFSLVRGNGWLQVILAIITGVLVCSFIFIFMSLSERVENSLKTSRIVTTVPGHTIFLKFFKIFAVFRNQKKALLKGHLVSYVGHGSMIVGIYTLSQIISSNADNVFEVLFAISVGIISSMVPIAGPVGTGTGNVGFDLSFQLINANYGAELAVMWQITFLLASQLGLIFFILGKMNCFASKRELLDSKTELT